MKFTVKTSGFDNISKKIDAAGGRVAHALAMQVARDTEPYVPFLTGSMANRTKVEGNKIIYPGPYARYLYYGKVMVDAATGDGPIRIVRKDGSEAIRFRKGATLKPTDRPLKFNKAFHSHATDHWFEASKAQNKAKWVSTAKKLMKEELK